MEHDLQLEFATEDAAWEALLEQYDSGDCVDNHRLAYLDDPYGLLGYRLQQDRGCCGSADYELKIAGRPVLIGFNYGH